MMLNRSDMQERLLFLRVFDIRLVNRRAGQRGPSMMKASIVASRIADEK
jgi:hypothetical protein